MNLLFQLLANGIVNGAVFSILACAFGLVYRSVKVFHIAFAGLFLIPPYVAFSASFWLNAPVWLAIILGIVAGLLTGYATERLLYRPFALRRASPAAVLVASLGAYIILENVLAMIFGNDTRFMRHGPAGQLRFGLIGLADIQALQLIISVITLIALATAIKRAKVFRAVWAMGDEPGLIPVLGLPVMRYRTLVFTLSAGLGGLAGCLIGLDVGVNPHMGMSYLLIAVVAVLTGGIDRYIGWIIGGFALAILQGVMVWRLPTKWTDLVTFVVLIGVLLFRPQGLLGQGRRLEEA
jgi:branched-chain amino acid transport system permease protein